MKGLGQPFTPLRCVGIRVNEMVQPEVRRLIRCNVIPELKEGDPHSRVTFWYNQAIIPADNQYNRVYIQV